MKQYLTLLFLLCLLGLACNISTTATPQVATLAPIPTVPTVDIVPPTSGVQPTEALVPTDGVAPIVTATPVNANLTCHELSLYLDPLLASGDNCEVVPAITEGMEMYPQYTQLTLQGYTLTGKFFEPHISVFPVQAYIGILPDSIPGLVGDLQNLIGGGAPGDTLPFLPSFPAAQIFHAQYKVNPFISGGGIRYLTEYAQYFAPVNNTDLFYTYQGLTNDGQFWVSAILPVNNPILPPDANSPPGGLSWEEFSNNFGNYINDMVNQLDSQPSESYSPSLIELDKLVSSIRIQP
jgi:hypothetical protein